MKLSRLRLGACRWSHGWHASDPFRCPGQWFPGLLFLAALALAGCSSGGAPRADAPPLDPARLAVPWSITGSWYRGQLHAHTTNSDGQLSPQEMVDCYHDGGYSFLALTDHIVNNHIEITDPSTLDSHGMVLLPGVEWWSPGGSPLYGFHLIAVGVTSLPQVGTSGPASTAFFRSQGALVFLAHPMWTTLPLTADDAKSLVGLTGMEIGSRYNDAPAGPLWDTLLLENPRLWGTAADDNHDGVPSRGRGWVVARAPSLSRESIMGALEAGHFYATSGPTLSAVAATTDRVDVRCSASVAISCISPLGTQTVTGSPWAPVSSASFPLVGTEPWVRIEVSDAQGHTAWSNAIPPKAVGSQGG